MSRELTELQMRVMEVIWDRGEATVSEVQARLQPGRRLARTTVATLLSRLEEKGVLTHRTRGREHVYRPLLAREEIRRAMVEAFADRAFGTDVPTMVKQLIGTDLVDAEDLQEVQRILARRKEELARRPRGRDEGPTEG